MNAATTQTRSPHSVAPMKRTGDDWREMVQETRRRMQESWERSDTDGSLSQWAGEQIVHRYMDNAAIADAGWTMSVWAAFDLDGNLITADRREGQYGGYFFAPQFEGKARFLNPSKADSFKGARAANERKGFREGWARVGVTYNERTAEYEADTSDFRGVDTADWYGDMLAKGVKSWSDHLENPRGL